MGGRVETRFELKTTYSDIMINYQFSQQLKLIGNGKFNHLTIILTVCPCGKHGWKTPSHTLFFPSCFQSNQIDKNCFHSFIFFPWFSILPLFPRIKRTLRLCLVRVKRERMEKGGKKNGEEMKVYHFWLKRKGERRKMTWVGGIFHPGPPNKNLEGKILFHVNYYLPLLITISFLNNFLNVFFDTCKQDNFFF